MRDVHRTQPGVGHLQPVRSAVATAACRRGACSLHEPFDSNTRIETDQNAMIDHTPAGVKPQAVMVSRAEREQKRILVHLGAPW